MLASARGRACIGVRTGEGVRLHDPGEAGEEAFGVCAHAIGQAEAHLDRLLALLLFPQPCADAVRRGARGGFLASRAGAGEQRLDLTELVPERGFVVHPHPRWRIGEEACYG
jgi:hypothetical protein